MTPQQMEQLKAVLAYEVQGIPLSIILIGVAVLGMIGFLLSARHDRSFLGRVFDLLMVLIATALLLACIWGGVLIGNQYGMVGFGFTGGVLVFWLFFYIQYSIRTAIRNRIARKKLAKELASRR